MVGRAVAIKKIIYTADKSLEAGNFIYISRFFCQFVARFYCLLALVGGTIVGEGEGINQIRRDGKHVQTRRVSCLPRWNDKSFLLVVPFWSVGCFTSIIFCINSQIFRADRLGEKPKLFICSKMRHTLQLLEVTKNKTTKGLFQI